MTTSDRVPVVGGVDCHSRVHHAVALDETGRRLGDRGFPTTSAGYADLLGWLRAFGAVSVVGVESTGSYGAALTRFLLQAGVRVVVAGDYLTPQDSRPISGSPPTRKNQTQPF